ncbi:MAG: 2-polyprenyl-3-methyl-6-methoxy-1,4-benzoquinone monooxygenase [Pseudomonadales bacterium]
MLDNIINGFDRSLRTLTGQQQAQRPTPAQAQEAPLSAVQREHAAGLMRVNHAGEVCAQALYEGQALVARSEAVRSQLQAAAAEEQDHLAWCEQRLVELDSRPSLLDPLFYGASFAMGAATALLGDRVSLGFVEATEDQVCQHLDEHLERLPSEDQRSREILQQMRADEARHGAEALAAGGQTFPTPVKAAMRLVSRVMTEATYRV